MIVNYKLTNEGRQEVGRVRMEAVSLPLEDYRQIEARNLEIGGMVEGYLASLPFVAIRQIADRLGGLKDRSQAFAELASVARECGLSVAVSTDSMAESSAVLEETHRIQLVDCFRAFYDADASAAIIAWAGAWNPNRRESWLDVQARALSQASDLVVSVFKKVNRLAD